MWRVQISGRRTAAASCSQPDPFLADFGECDVFTLLHRDAKLFFRLKQPSAEAILREVKDAVGTWKENASDLGIARTEEEIMAAAFEA